MKRILAVVLLLFPFLTELHSQNRNDLPMIGAQIIIEPWQAPEDVDVWFRSMKDNGMSVCRIRMFEKYMKTSDGSWDFTCFDTAFDAASRYGIKVFATLFPATGKDNSLGGFKHPQDDRHMSAISEYIKAVVCHYKDHPALYGWVLLNEPGTGGWLQNNRFTAEMRSEWESSPKAEGTWTEGYTSDIFNHQRFLMSHNVWYLEWLAGQVKRWDTESELHVNNHQIFENVAEYDFPAWRTFLTSLGASAHPSWHFGYFSRERYAMAMSANCAIVRSGAGDLPFWVTELQGGNNTYSGYNAFCPTAEETTQWLWTSVASGAKGIIFWCYNPRTVGEEAGEWCMLTNENTNSDRADAAKVVSECLKSNEGLFSVARPIDSKVTVMYIRESLWVEKEMQIAGMKDALWEGRQSGGVMKSAIGVYEALLSRGIGAHFMEMSEYDWTRNDFKGETIILANQISVPTYRSDELYHFVKCGGKLIIEGLTAFYDENLTSLFNIGRPLEKLLGGNLSEVKTTPGDFVMDIHDSAPVHLWKGTLTDTAGGTPQTRDEEGNITSLRNRYGEGETVWFPSLLSLGARRSGDYRPLADWLVEECTFALPVFFQKCEPLVMMSLMETENDYIAVLINKSAERKKVKLTVALKDARLVFADKTGGLRGDSVSICPEETIIITWAKSPVY